MATLKDVAAETGLTVSTVSRVLNNRGYISEEARAKVYEAMKKLNYQPNEVARSLSKQKSNTIGVIVPHIEHPYFAKLISRLERAAYDQGFKLLLFNSKDKEEREKEYLEMCKSNRVTGIILCSGTVDAQKFEGLNVPLITIERYLDTGTASVECDNRQGGILAARHFKECGCSHVLYLSGYTEIHMPADSRQEGFKEVCDKMGMQYTFATSSAEKYKTLDYHSYIENALKNYPEADGIFATSDVIAAQVIQVCAKCGIRIPEDMKLIGFDDVNIAVLTTPAITTIRQPMTQMAQLAIGLVRDVNGGKVVPNRTVLPVSLIVRETT